MVTLQDVMIVIVIANVVVILEYVTVIQSQVASKNVKWIIVIVHVILLYVAVKTISHVPNNV